MTEPTRKMLFASKMVKNDSKIIISLLYQGGVYFIPDTECVINFDILNLVKLGDGGLVLDLSQLLLVPPVPQKMTIASKVTQKWSSCFISLKSVSTSLIHSEVAIVCIMRAGYSNLRTIFGENCDVIANFPEQIWHVDIWNSNCNREIRGWKDGRKRKIVMRERDERRGGGRERDTDR